MYEGNRPLLQEQSWLYVNRKCAVNWPHPFMPKTKKNTPTCRLIRALVLLRSLDCRQFPISINFNLLIQWPQMLMQTILRLLLQWNINMNCNNLQFSKMLNLHEKYYTIDETQAWNLFNVSFSKSKNLIYNYCLMGSTIDSSDVIHM